MKKGSDNIQAINNNIREETMNQQTVIRPVLATEAWIEKIQARSMDNASCRNTDDLRGIEVVGGVFDGKKLCGTEFNFSRISNAVFRNCDVSRAEFHFTELVNVTFENCEMGGSSFYFAHMEDVTFQNCLLQNTEFDFACGTMTCHDCHMKCASFPCASLHLVMTNCSAECSEFNRSRGMLLEISGSDLSRTEFNDGVYKGTITDSYCIRAEFNGSDCRELVMTHTSMRHSETENTQGLDAAAEEEGDSDVDRELADLLG